HHRVGSTIRSPSPLRDRHPPPRHVERRRAGMPVLRPRHDRDGQDRARQRPAIRAPGVPELRQPRTRHGTAQEPHPHKERTMTTIYVRHDVTTIAEVNALALDEDQRENGAIVLYDGITCYWSINWATRNEIPGRWYDNSRDGLQLVDGDEVTVLVPIEAEEEHGARGDGEAEDFYLTRRLVTPWESV